MIVLKQPEDTDLIKLLSSNAEEGTHSGDNIRRDFCVMHAAICTHLTIPVRIQVHRSLMNHKESSGKS